MGEHVTVLLRETVDSLAVSPGGSYVDATLGGGGHAEEILRRAGEGARLLGIDRDPFALAAAGKRLAPFGERFTPARGNHAELREIAASHGFDAVDGVVMDLGVSSFQLDQAERGFSFREDGPLDMRMDPTCGETAAELLARLDEDELAGLLRRYGEEPNARRIARMIKREGETRPFETTAQLAERVERLTGRRTGRHPATRTFQALRMAVNAELPALERALEGALAILKPGGRLAVISFESLGDRIVKRFFAAHVGAEKSLPQGGSRWEGSLPAAAWVLRRPLVPSEAELAANPRARSAKLRAIRRLPDGETAFHALSSSSAPTRLDSPSPLMEDTP
jgi:16S rRNA (cytosine1402-N4)-methyltransferase